MRSTTSPLALAPLHKRIARSLPITGFQSDSLATIGRYSLTVFGLAFIAMVWAMNFRITNENAQALEVESQKSLIAIATLVGQNVGHTATEFDRTLKQLRELNDAGGVMADWPLLLNRKFIFNDQIVQVAVINRDGFMISSSAMLHPSTLVDLGDREHFRVHANAGNIDQLFISKPILGRASGRASIQFTRPLFNQGLFSGVLVVSLDPNSLLISHEGVGLDSNLGRLGIVVVGDDQIARAASGAYSGCEGSRVLDNGTPLDADCKARLPSGSMVSVFKNVDGFPLHVIVTKNTCTETAGLEEDRQARMRLAVFLTILSIAIIVISDSSGRFYERRIIGLAHRDVLTKLVNRRRFLELLQAACTRGKAARTFAIHLVDLDGFKAVNDICGHPIGDKLLQAVARRLRIKARSGDVVARLGGDEFAIIQFETGWEQAAQFASRICDALSQPFEIDDRSLCIAGSVGIALSPGDSSDANELLRLADLALYEAKSGACGRYVHFDVKLDDRVRKKRSMIENIKRALTNNEFELYFQPIYALATNVVTKYEVLVRWRHPTEGLIAPSDFIPIAEESGMIVELGDWILEQACRSISFVPQSEGLSVNCSPIQLKRPSFASNLESCLERYNISPDRLNLEITESTLIGEDQATLQNIATIRALGVQLSMDDFGTGYSSLCYLLRLPVSSIKIDRAFISMLEASRSANIVILGAIVQMAHALNMEVIAEGIENSDQIDILRGLGCDAGQGYLLGRPAPAHVYFNSQELLAAS